MRPHPASPPPAERIATRIIATRVSLAARVMRVGRVTLPGLAAFTGLGLFAGLALFTGLALFAGCGGLPSRGPASGPQVGNETLHRAELKAQIAAGAPAPPLLHATAASYWRSGLPDSARIVLEQAVAQDPRYTPSLAWLSRLDFEAGEIERAVARLEPLAAEPNPDPEILTNLAVYKLAWGEVDVAESLLRTSIDRHPHHAPAYGNLGYLHLQSGDLKSAEADLEQALARDDRVPEFHLNLGIVHRRQLRFEDATRDFQRAIALDPEFREAHHNLALLYQLYLFDEERAQRHFQRFVALGGQADPEVAALFRAEGGEKPATLSVEGNGKP